MLETSGLAQEQIGTRVHARAISCAGYSVASTKRAPRVHSTLLSHPTPFVPRAPFPTVAALFSTCDAKCRVGAERESNRERQRGPCRRKRRRWTEPSRESLIDFFEHLIAARRRRKMGRRLPKKDGETREAAGTRRKEVFAFSSILLLSDGLR